MESHQISSGTNSIARLPAWAMVFLVAVAMVVWVDYVATIVYTSGKLRKEAKMEHAYTVLGKRITLTPETAEVLGSAVGAAAMLGPNKTQGVLELPDAELGRLFKAGISQFLTVSAQLPFSTSDSRKKRVAKPARPAAEPASRRLDPGTLEKSAFKMRSALVTSGQLLPAQDIWEGLQMTRQALAKAVATGRIFTVDVGAAQYYPAFYLSGEIDRKTLSKVTQQLGTLPGWSKWQFFTQPKASLGDMTPLQALARGQVAQVGRAAAAFAER